MIIYFSDYSLSLVYNHKVLFESERRVTVPRPKGRGFPLHQGHTDARTEALLL